MFTILAAGIVAVFQFAFWAGLLFALNALCKPRGTPLPVKTHWEPFVAPNAQQQPAEAVAVPVGEIVQQIADRYNAQSEPARFREESESEVNRPIPAVPTTPNAVIADAIEALMGLGYKKRQAAGAVGQVLGEASEPLTVEQIVEAVLKAAGG
jgi:hypothetical protein